LREGVDIFEFLGFQIELDLGCDNAASKMHCDVDQQDEFSYIVLNLGENS